MGSISIPKEWYITPDLADISLLTFNDYEDPSGLTLDDFHGPFLIVPGTEITYYPLGKVYRDLTNTHEFSRLARIKQLGLVGASRLNICQEQDRGQHSYIVAAMMDIVLNNNHFSEHERKLGIAAGYTTMWQHFHSLTRASC